MEIISQNFLNRRKILHKNKKIFRLFPFKRPLYTDIFLVYTKQFHNNFRSKLFPQIQFNNSLYKIVIVLNESETNYIYIILATFSISNTQFQMRNFLESDLTDHNSIHPLFPFTISFHSSIHYISFNN